MPVVRVTFVAACDLTTFNATTFRTSLLQQFPEASDVILTVTAASIRVDVQLIMTSTEAASAANATLRTTSLAALSARLGAPIESVSEPTVTFGTVPVHASEAMATAQAQGGSSSSAVVIFAICGAAGLTVCIALLWLRRYRLEGKGTRAVRTSKVATNVRAVHAGAAPSEGVGVENDGPPAILEDVDYGKEVHYYEVEVELQMEKASVRKATADGAADSCNGSACAVATKTTDDRPQERAAMAPRKIPAPRGCAAVRASPQKQQPAITAGERTSIYAAQYAALAAIACDLEEEEGGMEGGGEAAQTWWQPPKLAMRPPSPEQIAPPSPPRPPQPQPPLSSTNLDKPASPEPVPKPVEAPALEPPLPIDTRSLSSVRETRLSFSLRPPMQS
jgi:hypothetical protein